MTREEQWLRQRWASRYPDKAGEAAGKGRVRRQGATQRTAGGPARNEEENLCRPSLEALEETLVEEQERMRAAYRRAGL